MTTPEKSVTVTPAATKPAGATPAALELAGISKRFGALDANRDVSLRVEPGAIHAVVGENGAGKSTLFRIAYGEIRADAGRIAIRGRDVPIGRHSPSLAIELGLGMVHQHFMLVPPLTVTENVVLGREPRRGPLLDLGSAREELRALSLRLGLDVQPDRRVEELSVGEQQRVEIVKVLWRGAEVLLLDEPTAVLSPPEVKELLGVMRKLAEEGKAIILVTHRLDEVAEVADRVTVMRRGKVVAELSRGATREELAREIVGRELGAGELPVALGAAGAAAHEGQPPAGVAEPASSPTPALAVEGLETRGVGGVSFEVAPGEIFGIAGVQGNGQRELIEALAGLLPAFAGTVRLCGRPLDGLTPRARLGLGLGHVPEDRHLRGLVLDFDLADNLILGRQWEFTGALGLSRRRIAANARERVKAFDVRPPDPAAIAATLSGGNQQKVVMGRELARPGLKALLCAEPTRGVDIGAAAVIHQGLRAARDAGAGILLVSSELAELRALCRRIAVMYRGRFVAVLPVESADDAALGGLMTGARSAAPDAAPATANAAAPAEATPPSVGAGGEA